MSVLARTRPGFDIDLTGPSVRALGADQRRCAHCHRTPLVGELICFYGERRVCELCRPRRREAPSHQEIMHSPEHTLTVRRLKAPARA